MKNFEIIVINKRWIIIIFIILFLLSVSSVIILLLIGALYLLFPVILMILVYIYGKRYFTYLITIKPVEEGFEMSSKYMNQVVFYNHIDYYRIEKIDGIRLELHLKNKQKINLIATNNFKSTPESLEAFSNYFESQIENYQGELVLIKKKESFFKTKAALLLAIILTIFGIGGAVLSVIKGKEVGVELLVIVIPIIMLWLAISSARR